VLLFVANERKEKERKS